MHLSAILKDKAQPFCGILAQVYCLVYQPNTRRESTWARECEEQHWEQDLIKTCLCKESAEPLWNAFASAVAISFFCLAYFVLFLSSTCLFCTLEGDCSTPSNLSDLRSSNYSNLSWIPGSSVKAMDLQTSQRWVPACDVGSFSLTFPGTSKSHPCSWNTPSSTPHMLLPTTLLVACDEYHIKN